MKKHKLILFLLCSLAPLEMAYSKQLSVEVRGEYETWASGLGGQASAFLAGGGIAYYLNQYYIGGGFVTGDYQIENNANADLRRNDIDFVAGYRIDNRLSTFIGYRFNRMSYTSSDTLANSFDENTHGLGVGVSYTQKLKPKWGAFATMALSGLYATTNYSNNLGDDTGKGFSLGTEGGLFYRIQENMNIALRLKYQSTRLDYSETDWPHSYFRVGLNLDYYL